MITTLKVNVVGYIFPPERTCQRLRACSGFGYIAKFGTGVAFKIPEEKLGGFQKNLLLTIS
jgi:hypothetical protein